MKNKSYGYNCVVCQEPLKEPQELVHTDEGLAHESCCETKPQKCSIEPVSRRVIENQLLTALDDKSRVAILASEEDLDLFIEALVPMWAHTKAQEMLADIRQLKAAAFAKK